MIKTDYTGVQEGYWDILLPQVQRAQCSTLMANVPDFHAHGIDTISHGSFHLSWHTLGQILVGKTVVVDMSHCPWGNWYKKSNVVINLLQGVPSVICDNGEIYTDPYEVIEVMKWAVCLGINLYPTSISSYGDFYDYSQDIESRKSVLAAEKSV